MIGRVSPSDLTTGETSFATTYQATESVHKILTVKPIDAKLIVVGAK